MESRSHVSATQCNSDDDDFEFILGDEKNDKLDMNAHQTVVSSMKSDENDVTVAINNTIPAKPALLSLLSL